jgi:hypothetical protein
MGIFGQDSQDQNLVAQVVGLAGGHIGLLDRLYGVLRSNGLGLRLPVSPDPICLPIVAVL